MTKKRRHSQFLDQPTKDRILALLRSGHTTRQVADRIGIGLSTAGELARKSGFVVSKTGPDRGKWIEGQEQPDMPIRTITSDVAWEMAELLIGGETTYTVGAVYGFSNTSVGEAVRRIGLVFLGHPGHGKWIRKEENAAMNGQTNDEWNMSTDDYTALLKTQRHDLKESPFSPTDDDQTTYVKSETQRAPDVQRQYLDYTIDDAALGKDVAEALDLLAQAEQQRKQDLAVIGEMESRVDGLLEVDGKWRATIEARDHKIAQLESEVKRLMSAVKTEISRGLLRQGMDSLRKVL